MPEPTDAGKNVWNSLRVGYKAYLVKDLKLKITDFTCCNCPHVQTCPSAYDGYNTSGDCLELK